MHLGIKTGLRNDWKKDIKSTHPDFCEIWFDATKLDYYDELMTGISNLGPKIGLHYWGALPDGTLTNIAYPNTQILKTSISLIKKSIEYAAKFMCVYVNIHPSGKILAKVDFEKEIFTPYTPAANLDVVLENLSESVNDLAQFAHQKGVIFTVESTPKLALGSPWHGSASRLKPVSIGEFIVDEIESIYNIPNVYFAHDFSHTGAQVITNNRNEVKQKIFDIARRLKNKTQLLHVSYTKPPYNGSDYHGNLYNEEIHSLDAVPNYDELIELLHLYKNQNIFALVEPESDHIGNFNTLKNLAKLAHI